MPSQSPSNAGSIYGHAAGFLLLGVRRRGARSGSKIVRNSVGDFVVAGVAAGFAVVESVLAEANLHLRLAQATIALALAAVLGHFALHAAVLVLGGSSHGRTVAAGRARGKCRW